MFTERLRSNHVSNAVLNLKKYNLNSITYNLLYKNTMCYSSDSLEVELRSDDQVHFHKNTILNLNLKLILN